MPRPAVSSANRGDAGPWRPKFINEASQIDCAPSIIAALLDLCLVLRPVLVRCRCLAREMDLYGGTGAMRDGSAGVVDSRGD